MTNPTLWNQILIWPITNLLVLFYKIFEFFHIPGPLGFAIIFMTITFRVILYPIMSVQMKSARKMAKLKPHLDELNKKHKDDKKTLQQAQMALYKEHGVNPAAGCLPLLLQMPILIALYNVFFQVFNNPNTSEMITNINAILYAPQLHLQTLDLTFLGFNLAIKPSAFQTAGIWLLTIPVITGLLQWYQTKLMMVPHQAKPQEDTKPSKSTAVVKKTNEKPEKAPEDMMQDMQKQMAIISPIMFGFFAYQFPIGLALYWNIFGLFGIIQQRYINKRHG